MKSNINLLPKKTKEEVKGEKLAFKLDFISAVVLIIVEIFSFSYLLYSEGLNTKVVSARTEYHKNLSNLKKFAGTENLINNINQRYGDILLLKKSFINPLDIVNELNKQIPSNTSISDINYTYGGQVSFQCSTQSVLDAAHFLYIFSNYNPNNKYFSNTQISGLNIINTGPNESVTFSVTTSYNGP